MTDQRPPSTGRCRRRGGKLGRRLHFEWRYWTGRPPWDSGITPPEVLDFLQRTPPGRAVDFGCGTGTNAITLARHGWTVTAIDFSRRALRLAERKARDSGADVRFLRRDVGRLQDLAGPFDFALDIGCFHGLDLPERERYASTLARVLPHGAILMLYSFLNPEEGWPAESEVRRLLSPAFELVKLEHGEFEGRASGWFTWKRRS